MGAVMVHLTLLLVLASSFPLPSLDRRPLAVAEGQTSFRLPQRFDAVRAFYAQRFQGQAKVSLRLEGTPGARVLTLTNRDRADAWRSATVTERPTETLVEVTPVLRMAEDAVEGSARPLVELVIGRSPEVDRALKSIDHTEAIRR
jgi:hypothetical protein